MDLDVPPRQTGWQSRYTATHWAGTAAPVAELPWRPCHICWGQRQIFHAGQFVGCPWCLAVGEVPST